MLARSWHTERAIGTRQFRESCGTEVTLPGGQPVVTAEAIPEPALLVPAARVERKQNSARPERSMYRSQHDGQFLGRNVKQGGAGEHPVIGSRRELQREQILLQHRTARVCTRHVGKARRSVDAARSMTLARKVAQIATGSTPEVEQVQRTAALQVAEEQIIIRSQIAMLRLLPVRLGHAIVRSDRQRSYLGAIIEHGPYHNWRNPSVGISFEKRLKSV